ncbi:MAG: hypothetical protein ACRDB3_17795 [Citrobacter telavivensis]
MSTKLEDAARAVQVAEAIFEGLSCGIEPDYNLLQEAHELGLSVEAIREKVEELYGTEDEDQAYD